MRLYHFTCLFNLPWIIREGITKGEVPVGPMPLSSRPNAANLTDDPSREHQSQWTHGSVMDKTKVRITIDVPDADLTPFCRVKEQFKIRNSWLKRIDSLGYRRHWYFAFGGVPPDQIASVEVHDGHAYHAVADDELRTLIAAIDEERESKLEVIPDPTGLFVRFKSGFTETWLFDA